jgi:hypothetical protein
MLDLFRIGQATITRVEETYGPTYPITDIFPGCTSTVLSEHGHWLAPSHFDAQTGLIKLSVHSWLLQIGRQKILVDACCGNNKVKPGRPFWHMLNVPFLERLAAAGARPEEIDYVMCTHLHHDHVGWNTQLRDGRWVPTFPNARYVISKTDFEYYRKLDSDDATAPAEMGTFRECVLPLVEAGRADLVSGGPLPQRAHRADAGAGPFRGPRGVQARSGWRARRVHRRRIPSPPAGVLSGLEFSQKLGPRAGACKPPPSARALRLVRCARAACACGRAVCRPHRGNRKGIPAPLLARTRFGPELLAICLSGYRITVIAELSAWRLPIVAARAISPA